MRTPQGYPQARQPRGSRDHLLLESVRSYLQSVGGSASSRDVGRRLAADGLLKELKKQHSGLFHFLQRYSHEFSLQMPTEKGVLEYEVRLAVSAAPHGGGGAGERVGDASGSRPAPG